MKRRLGSAGRGPSLATTIVPALGGLAVLVAGMLACSGPHGGGGDAAQPSDAAAPRGPASLGAPALSRSEVPTRPNYTAGPADLSRSQVQHGPRISVSQPFASRPLRDLPDGVSAPEMDIPEPGRNPVVRPFRVAPDPVVQSSLPIVTMPATLHDFLAQGTTLGGCIFPKPDGGEPPGCTTLGDPPDTVGAVGPTAYVQLVNSGIGIWDKSGAPLITQKFTSLLWTGYPTTDGNGCGAPPSPNPPGGDWGDGVVLYDQMADRWIITQFDITNFVQSNSGPSYQCVAVSKTGDPTGAYWLYDFQYSAAINDYGKFSVWPDAYYATFNDFDPNFTGADLCAYDRVSMLQGKPATQQCFANSGFGFLSSNVDGAIKPPNGEPGFFVTLGNNTIDLYKLQVDWTTPANSTLTGPTSLPVAAFNDLCGGGDCVPQASPGNQLASLGDRPMFHLSYRNFGATESLVFNHSVAAGATAGPRWYEIRSPNGAPVVFQQGTYAPADGNWRWMGSISQDQAGDMALGYSISSAASFPSIGWTGRTAGDPFGTMGQAETVVQAGTGVETGSFKNGQLAQRWGDYSNMTVDPSDDCTFWYTQELYPSNGKANWDTRIASVKFPGCAANDFTISLLPATQNLQQGLTAIYTVTTALAKGSAETIALFIQDLPAGVTGAFAPTSVSAGGASTLTLTAGAAAPLASSVTFTVIGAAPSAVHAATAVVNVVTPCVPLVKCPAADNCGTISDGCSGMVTCGPACTAPQSCGGSGTPNVCGCTPVSACPAPDNCGTIPDGCGGMVTCGSCTAGAPCVSNQCSTPPMMDAGPDAGAPGSDSGPFGIDSGPGADSGIAMSADAGLDSGGPPGAGNSDSGGCGCKTAASSGTSSGVPALAGFGVLGLVMARRRRRR